MNNELTLPSGGGTFRSDTFDVSLRLCSWTRASQRINLIPLRPQTTQTSPVGQQISDGHQGIKDVWPWWWSQAQDSELRHVGDLAAGASSEDDARAGTLKKNMDGKSEEITGIIIQDALLIIHPSSFHQSSINHQSHASHVFHHSVRPEAWAEELGLSSRVSKSRFVRFKAACRVQKRRFFGCFKLKQISGLTWKEIIELIKSYQVVNW